MKWVLIYWIAITYGITTNSIDFSSKEKCVAAKIAIQDIADTTNGPQGQILQAICVKR